MVAITDSDGWVPVTRPEITDIALGGNETNFPGKYFRELASRDQYLYETALGGDATAIASAVVFRQLGIAAVAQGRLTLQAGVPVSTTDQTAKTVLYYTPYNGDYVALYDTVNTRWDLYQFTERSLNLSGLAANTNYDIFIYNISGTLVLQPVAWATSGAGTSTRASAITQLESVWVKDSDKRRYLGTIRTTAVAGQCEDSLVNRFVWNVSNQTTRFLKLLDAVNHTYTTSSWRNYNNNSTFRVNLILGLASLITITLSSHHQGDSSFVTAEPTYSPLPSSVLSSWFVDYLCSIDVDDGITIGKDDSRIESEGFIPIQVYQYSAGSVTTPVYYGASVKVTLKC